MDVRMKGKACMKKSYVKVISILSVAVIAACYPVASFADSASPKEAADALHQLGLFQGTGIDKDGNPDYALERVPSRAEAVTMLVRLLGKEDEAKAGDWSTPFKDVPEWAAPYVGYAYVNNLTKGISSDAFGSTQPVSTTQYQTFLLRSLGYSSDSDFQWDSAWTLCDTLGICRGEYGVGTKTFLRGDAARLAFSALSAKRKGADTTLYTKLLEDGAIINPNLEVPGFGAESLNKGLMKLNPDETELIKPGRLFHFYWDDPEKYKKVSGYLNNCGYPFEKIRTCTITTDWGWVGTRCEVLADAEAGALEYSLEQFSGDGTVVLIKYTVSEGTMLPPAIGDAKINEYIYSFNPDEISQTAVHYAIFWEKEDPSDEIRAYLDNVVTNPENVYKWSEKTTLYPLYRFRVEITVDERGTWYTVTQFTPQGTLYTNYCV